jgi:hypothetical protein
VEIGMMEKQISKKKLERLTIHGGDFRRAGRLWAKSTDIAYVQLDVELDVEVGCVAISLDLSPLILTLTLLSVC